MYVLEIDAGKKRIEWMREKGEREGLVRGGEGWAEREGQIGVS